MLIPKNRHEYYLAVISGNDYPTFPPKTREEQYLAKLAGREVDVPSPRTPKERAYYNIINDIKFEPENRWQTFVAAANDDSITAPIPRTREEIWWSNISLSHEVIVEYTGTLPTTLQTVEGHLESYKIYGNTVQDGTPTPENPIMPSGCGVRTENLFDLNRLPSDTWTTDTRYYINGGIITSKTVTPAAVTISVNNDTLSVSTTGGRGAGFLVEVKPSTEYRLVFTKSESLASDITSCMYAFVDTSETIGQAQAIYGNADSVVFTTDSNTNYIYFVFRKALGAISYSNIMLTEGSTASSSYIPYGYKLPILSNSNSTNIYLGEVPTTRRIKKLVLNGEEAWRKDSNVGQSARYYIVISDIENNTQNLLSSHFAQSSGYEIGTMNNYRTISVFSVDKTLYPTTDDFKSYLAAQYAAGTPVTVWYVLAEPETGIVNEPLMKIGNYADTIDSTQTSAQIPTAAGETTISWAGEGLAPSEVELTYKTIKKTYISADDKVYQDPNGQLLGG